MGVLDSSGGGRWTVRDQPSEDEVTLALFKRYQEEEETCYGV
jgi:hypothetical protein